MLFLEGNLDSITTIGILIFILLTNLFCYFRIKKVGGVIMMMFITFFNIYLVFESLTINLPLAPYTQLFFLIGNILLLIIKVFEI